MRKLLVLAGMVLAMGWVGAPAASAVTDDTAVLQRRIDALPEGGTLALEARSYRFQDLRIGRSLTIVGRGEERTLCQRGTARPFFTVTGETTRVSFQKMTLDGGRLEAAGINAVGIAWLHLDGVRVRRCGVPPAGSIPSDRDGKSIDGVYATDVEQALVQHCLLEANARDGFIGIPVRHLTFTGNVCRGNGRMGCTSDVDPEGRTGGPLEVVYQDNEVSDCGTGGLHVETEERYPVAVGLFERNKVDRVGNRDWGYSWGLVLGLHCRGVLRANRITGTGLQSTLQSYRCGILVAKPGGDVVIEGNRVQDSGRSGISVGDSPYPVTLLDNQVQGSRLAGITAYKVEHLRIERCTVEAAGQWGLWCRLCPGAVVRGNHLRGNSSEAPGRYAAAMAEASPGILFQDNDFGGPPQSMGLELGSNFLALATKMEGNTFEGRRSHPKLSSFSTSN